jgi:hypothetical protein
VTGCGDPVKGAAARCGHASTTLPIKHKITGGEGASQI